MTAEVISADDILTEDVVAFFAALVLREMERRAAEKEGEENNENENVHTEICASGA